MEKKRKKRKKSQVLPSGWIDGNKAFFYGCNAVAIMHIYIWKKKKR